MSESDYSGTESDPPSPEASTPLVEPGFHSFPCLYQPSCEDQCPGFMASDTEPMRCLCGHFKGLHRLPNTKKEGPTQQIATMPSSSSAFVPASTSSSVPASQQPAWMGRVASLKRKREDAEAEVNSGFLARKKGKGRAVSTPTYPTIQRKVSSRLAAAHKGKEPNPMKSTAMERVRGIYFVDNAHVGMTETTNNSLQKSYRFSNVPALSKGDLARLEGTCLARCSTPGDLLWLDTTMDAQRTAEHLAELFPDVYALVKTSEEVPSGWFFQLVKTQRKLGSPPNQVGATADQLIKRASTEARSKVTRDIFLAIPTKLTASMRSQLKLASLSDGSMEDSDSDHSEQESHSVLAGSSSRAASATKPLIPDVARPRPRPRLRVVPHSPSPSSTITPAGPSIVEPSSPANTVLEDDMTELEAATSSFVLDDVEVLDLTGPSASSSPVTRSKHAHRSLAAAEDPVLASYSWEDDVNPFSLDYSL